MTRLMAKDIKGIWAGLTMSWDDRDLLDENSYRLNIDRMCRSKVHGIYTTGSTGEFYALNYEEFCRMVDIQAEICGRYHMPLQIGCCSDNTRETIRLLEYAAQKQEVSAAQIVIPYWMELTDRELLRFFMDLYKACPEMPLVHYNIPRSKRYLKWPDYLRILEVAPSLIGVKFTFSGSHFADLQEALHMTPELSYFVGEDLLVSAMMLGANGSYSSLVSTNPVFMLTLYEHAIHRRWEEALKMQKIAMKFSLDATSLIRNRGEGMADPVFDKGMAVASGCFAGSQRTRSPHIGWSNETVAQMRGWLEQNYPQFLYEGS